MSKIVRLYIVADLRAVLDRLEKAIDAAETPGG